MLFPKKIVFSHGQFEDLDLGGSPSETKVTLLLSRPQKVQLLGGDVCNHGAPGATWQYRNIR